MDESPNENKAAGAPSALNVGLGFERGQIVTIRKGARIKSLHPEKGEYISKRAQKVKLHLVLRGFTHYGIEHLPEVSWAGSGGYWCYAYQKDVVPNAKAQGRGAASCADSPGAPGSAARRPATTDFLKEKI